VIKPRSLSPQRDGQNGKTAARAEGVPGMLATRRDGWRTTAMLVLQSQKADYSLWDLF